MTWEHHVLRRWALLALVLAALSPRAARAQWSEAPVLIALPSGDDRWGFSAGMFRFSPRLAAEFRWDSNVFREDQSEHPKSAPILAFAPALTMVNPKPGLFRLYLDLKGDFRIYFGEDPAGMDQSNAGGTATFDLDFWPNGPFTLRVFDRFSRALLTRNDATSGTFTRNFNLAGIRGVFRPGGGALEFGLEYAYGFDFFDELGEADKRFHDLGFRASWKFYPLTRVFVDVDFKIIGYDEPWLSVPTRTPNVDSMPLRATAGIDGYITKRLSILAQAGWAQGFYADGPELGGPIGLARVSYRVAKGTLLQLGYERAYQDSLHGNWSAEHRIFFAGQQQLWNRLDINATASYSFIDFSRFEYDDAVGLEVSDPERSEQMLRVAASARFDIARWLAVEAGYSYEALFSDFSLLTTAEEPPRVVQVFSYYRHQVYASVIGRY